MHAAQQAPEQVIREPVQDGVIKCRWCEHRADNYQALFAHVRMRHYGEWCKLAHQSRIWRENLCDKP